MYARITPDQEDRVTAEVRRLRVRSAVLYYPVMVALFSAIAIVFVIFRGHGLLRLLERAFDGQYTEEEMVARLAVVIVVLVATALLFILRGVVNAPLFEEHGYCRRCNAVDRLDEGTCPICGQVVTEQERFFVSYYGDERALAERFGLSVAEELRYELVEDPRTVRE